MKFIAAVLLAIFWTQTANAEDSHDDHSQCTQDATWATPQSPVRIHGNTWHVGPRGLGVFIITSDTGHVLIDGGIPGQTQLIKANLRALGLQIRDIKWILVSHAHCDHAGGVAELARDTGAQVIAGSRDVASLASGGRNDPHYGNRFRYPPVRGSRAVADGESLRLGDLTLNAHATPGHTMGNTTWTWQACDQARCLNMVLVGSLSAPDYKLIGNPRHPEIAKDYQRSFQRIAGLPCDIALAPHPGMVDFWERIDSRDQGQADALIDTDLCSAYADQARGGFEKELERQRKAAIVTRRRLHRMDPPGRV